MSLLTVAQAVAEEVGLPAPTAVIGSTDKTAKLLLRLINRAGKRLAKKNWTVLQKEYTFSTADGTADYALPSDFDRLLDMTAWDRSLYWSLRGPTGPALWQVRKSGLVAPSIRKGFRIKPSTRVNRFYLDPTPSSIASMVFEYASDQWVKNAANDTGKSAYALDTDVAILSEELIELEVIWRLLNRKGFAYEEERQEAKDAIDLAFAEDGGAAVLNLGGPARVSEARRLVPEGGFG